MKMLNWFLRLFKSYKSTQIIAFKYSANLPKELPNKFEQLKHCVEYLNEFNTNNLKNFNAKVHSDTLIECKLNVIDLLNNLETYVNSIEEGGDLLKATGIANFNSSKLLLNLYFSKDNLFIKPLNAYYLLTEYNGRLLIALTDIYELKPEYFNRKLTLILREVCVAIETLYKIGIESHDRSKNERNIVASRQVNK